MKQLMMVVGLLLAVPVRAETASTALPSLKDPVSLEMLGQLLGGLLVVVIAILLVLWVLKRFTAIGGHHRDLKVVAVLPLGTREKAVLVQVGERQLLIGVAPGRVSLLERFEEPVILPPQGGKFRAKLREALAQQQQQDGW
ncbi:MAG: flagellar biosynthetic protein FliO [Oceanospirillaceae bacterium]|nr:flagellar biosynthetic protein FliO [Oceanospirillaceae bacterium]